jgi:serine/threonine-protein kinase RsbW/sigma-B regulation protein RsbU (phosphoserine phosphatase)
MTCGPSEPIEEQREFAARYASLAATAAFAEAVCTRHALDRSLALRLALVLEELLTNTIEHGFGAQCDAPIRISLRVDGTGVTLRYEDSAPPFDPLAQVGATACSIEDPLEQRPVGGLGLRLVEGLTRDARYEYADGRNQLSLILRATDDSSPGPMDI